MLTNVETGYKKIYGPDARDIQGMTILVTGDARAVGRVTSTLLTEHGAQIFFAASSAHSLESALEAIRKAGGEADGMVVDFSLAEAAQQCFEAAARRFGPVQALVNALTGETAQKLNRNASRDAREDIQMEHQQNIFTQEALMRLQGIPRAQIINVGQIKHDPSARSMAAGLRKQASELGIRMTMVEPGDTQTDCAEAVARCVLGSLVQPFGVDAIFLYDAGSQPVL
jgi:NAD(P)-dependent dehydrogenase (short-subunit alcohol dehydrogenase family)